MTEPTWPLGHPSDPAHPGFLAAAERVRRVAAAHNYDLPAVVARRVDDLRRATSTPREVARLRRS